MWCLFRGLGRAEDAEDMLDRVAASVTDPDWLAYVDAVRCSLFKFAGQVERASGIAQSLLDQPSLSDGAFLRAIPGAGTCLLLQGGADRVIEMTDRALPLSVSVMHTNPYPVRHVMALRLLALASLGRFDEAEALIAIVA
jgi:hypothetical protein